MTRKARKQYKLVTDDLIQDVAARKAVGISNQSISDELGLSRYHVQKITNDARYLGVFYKAVETVAACCEGMIRRKI